jgi:Uma2 family endonuclease
VTGQGSFRPVRRYSYEDYLDTLARSEVKLEYCAGIVSAMPVGTLQHAALGARMIAAIGRQLPASCEGFNSDAKVRVEETDFAGFPDASVVCGPVQHAPSDAHALANPTLLIEVTSKSTEAYDRGEKLEHYQRIPALRAVLFVSHRAPRVTLVERTNSGWTTRDFGPGERLVLTAPALTLSVDELYAGITLDPD